MPAARKPRHVPLRRCAACGKQAPKAELVRIVRTPQGEIAVDPRGKRSGRGAYLCADAACWERGLVRRRVDAVLKAPLTMEQRAALRAALETVEVRT